MLSSALYVLLVTVAGAVAAGPSWGDFRAHLIPGSYFYKQLPRTAADAIASKWITPDEDSGSILPYKTLCPFSDPSMCCIYDKNGFIAGMQFGLVKSNAVAPLNFAKLTMFVSKTRFTLDCYVVTFFFVEQSVLNAGGRTNLTTSGTGTGLWLQTGPTADTLLTIPRFEKDLKGTGFTKEPCVIGQGTQYYQNITSTTDCAEMLPMVALYTNGEMNGFGFQTNGKYTPIGGNNWMEHIPTAVINPTLYDPPKCLSEWADKYNLFSLHVFFNPNPQFNFCSLWSMIPIRAFG